MIPVDEPLLDGNEKNDLAEGIVAGAGDLSHPGAGGGDAGGGVRGGVKSAIALLGGTNLLIALFFTEHCRSASIAIEETVWKTCYDGLPLTRKFLAASL